MKEEKEKTVCICTKQTGADKAGREGKDEALKKERKRKGLVVEEKREEEEEEGRGDKEREETLVGKHCLRKEGNCRRETHYRPAYSPRPLNNGSRDCD